jgi:CRISPR-associated protein Csx14
MDEVLVATLGVTPQVVTLALDELLAQGHAITRVVVLHTSTRTPAIDASLRRLREAASPTYPQEAPHHLPISPPVGPPIVWEWLAIVDGDGIAITDTTDESHARAVFRCLYRTVLGAKKAGARVHLSIAGGRKVMSAYGVCVAQLLFDEGDCCWHLASEDRLLHGGAMHAPPGWRAALIPVPVLRWSALPPVATALALTDDPFQAVEMQHALVRNEERERLRQWALQVLSEAHRETLWVLAREGLSNEALARRLFVSPGRIANRITEILSLFREFKGIPDSVPLNSRSLIAAFAPVVGDEPDDAGFTAPSARA